MPELAAMHFAACLLRTLRDIAAAAVLHLGLSQAGIVMI